MVFMPSWGLKTGFVATLLAYAAVMLGALGCGSAERRRDAATHAARMSGCPRAQIKLISEKHFDSSYEGGLHHWQDVCGRQRRLTFYYRMNRRSVHKWIDTTPMLYLVYGSRRPLDPQEAEGRISQEKDGMTGRVSTELSMLDDLSDLYVRFLTGSNFSSHAVQFATVAEAGDGWRFLKCSSFTAKADGKVWELEADHDGSVKERGTLETVTVMLPDEALAALSKANDARVRFCNTQVALGPARKEKLAEYLQKAQSARKVAAKSSAEDTTDTPEVPTSEDSKLIVSDAPPIEGASPFKFGMSIDDAKKACERVDSEDKMTERLHRVTCGANKGETFRVGPLPGWHAIQLDFLDDKLASLIFTYVFRFESDIEDSGIARYERILKIFEDRIKAEPRSGSRCLSGKLSNGRCLGVTKRMALWKRSTDGVLLTLERINADHFGIRLRIEEMAQEAPLLEERKKAKTKSLNEAF